MTLLPFLAQARVRQPAGLTAPYTVFVNGVEQSEGRDFCESGAYLDFQAALRQEGSLGFWRWAIMLIGLAGSYGQNDCVDILFEREGDAIIETALPIHSLVGEGADSGLPIAGRSFDARTGPFSRNER